MRVIKASEIQPGMVVQRIGERGESHDTFTVKSIYSDDDSTTRTIVGVPDGYVNETTYYASPHRLFVVYEEAPGKPEIKEGKSTFSRVAVIDHRPRLSAAKPGVLLDTYAGASVETFIQDGGETLKVVLSGVEGEKIDKPSLFGLGYRRSDIGAWVSKYYETEEDRQGAANYFATIGNQVKYY